MSWIEMTKRLKLGLPPRAPRISTSASISDRFPLAGSGSSDSMTTSKTLRSFTVESIIDVDELAGKKALSSDTALVTPLIERAKIVGTPSLLLEESPKLHGESVVLSGSRSEAGTDSDVSVQKCHGPEPKQMDEKTAKRVLSNRLYAQKAWIRKQEYIADLEMRKTAMQVEVNSLRLQVVECNQHYISLKMQNNAMKQRIAHLIQDEICKDAEMKFLNEEKRYLMRLFVIQQELLNDIEQAVMELGSRQNQ